MLPLSPDLHSNGPFFPKDMNQNAENSFPPTVLPPSKNLKPLFLKKMVQDHTRTEDKEWAS